MPLVPKDKRMNRRKAVRPRLAGAQALRSTVRRSVRGALARLRADDGFGLMEILLAIIFITIAITVLVAGFASATTAINRASRISTAGVIADSQMERFRSMSYAYI